jgi:septal ring factor EnvC (AmiA/AmiB activator)
MTEDTMKWIFNNGLAVTIVIGVSFAVWRGCNAFFSTVVVPLKDAAISHLQSTTQHLDATNRTLQKTEQTMDRVCLELRECRTDISHIKQQTNRCGVHQINHDRTV